VATKRAKVLASIGMSMFTSEEKCKDAWMDDSRLRGSFQGTGSARIPEFVENSAFPDSSGSCACRTVLWSEAYNKVVGSPELNPHNGSHGAFPPFLSDFLFPQREFFVAPCL
jgi:hypothetical protein